MSKRYRRKKSFSRGRKKSYHSKKLPQYRSARGGIRL